MNPTITRNFNEILQIIQTSQQKALRNAKLTPLVIGLARNIGYKGKNNAA